MSGLHQELPSLSSNNLIAIGERRPTSRRVDERDQIFSVASVCNALVNPVVSGPTSVSRLDRQFRLALYRLSRISRCTRQLLTDWKK